MGGYSPDPMRLWLENSHIAADPRKYVFSDGSRADPFRPAQAAGASENLP
jgi:hypothetical protein